MADRPMILRGVIHGRSIVLDRDPGFEDGCEVDVCLSPLAEPPSEGGSATNPCNRWPEECGEVQRILPGEEPHPDVDGWAEFTD